MIGHESFIDLKIAGVPEVVMDNINCTGNEKKLTDCMYDEGVADCDGEAYHKVGVRCHEESKIMNYTYHYTCLNTQ